MDFPVCPLAVMVTTLPDVGTPATEVGFKLPLAEAGEHKIKVKVYVDDLTDGNNVEEAEFFYHTRAKPWKDASNEFQVNMMHKTEGLWNAVQIKFTPEIKIPLGGMIEVEFHTDNLAFDSNLGWDYPSLTKNIPYPCVHTNVGTNPTCMMNCGT
jgi:hypothetical protein